MYSIRLRACAIALAAACAASADETCSTCPDSIWGTGADGNLTIGGGDIVTLTRDMHYCHVTIEFLGFLDTAGYTVYVSGVLDNEGFIIDPHSGGDGGSEGTAGLGADPAGDDEQGCGLPTECTAGGTGDEGGAALLAGAGAGGDGGCGGNGGGGAYYHQEIEFDADGGCGGAGGRGGEGGGVIRIFAYRFANEGFIIADGTSGSSGVSAPDDHAQCGAEHEEITGGAPLDLSGGGGGGGSGGNGGDGGTIEITYAHLSGSGAITANGGSGGFAGDGGAHGGCLTFGAGGTSQSGCANENCAGFGDGGDGQHFLNQCPTDGAPGADGMDGQDGTVTLTRAIGDDCNGNGNPDDCDIRCQLSADCNRNGVPDSCDIASGASDDGDGNGVPDECVTPPDWHESFDEYDEGDLAGLGGWEPWDDDPELAGFTVTGDAWQSCPHALAITGVNDAVHAFSGYTDGTWELSANVLVPCELVEPQYLILLNTYESGGAKNWSLELRFDAVGGSIHENGSGASARLVPGEWNEVSVVVDLDRDVQTVYANGDAFASKSWTDGSSGGGAAEIAAVDLWGDGSESVVWYDDLSLSAVDPGGSCCFLAGSCFHVNQGSDCDDIGGTYQGDGTHCDVIECEESPCAVTYTPGAIDESELACDGYADLFNSGCNTEAEAFLTIGVGDVIHGTSGNYDGPLPCGDDTDCADQCIDGFCNTDSLLRDTDWYEFTLDEPTRVRIGGVADFPLQLLLMDGTDGSPQERVTIDQRYADPCRAVSMVRDLEPGLYWLWAGKQGGGDLVPCTSEYEISLDFVTGNGCLDLDGNGDVSFGDLLFILANFGSCEDCIEICGETNCPGDFDADCQVGFTDLIAVLSSWGACP